MVTKMEYVMERLIVILVLVGWTCETNAMSYDYNCTGTFFPTEGLISCMGYYTSPVTCIWRFSARPGTSFNFILNTFDIDTDDVECLYEYVEVRDGPSEVSPLLFGPECRNLTDLPRTIRGNSTFIWIRFRYGSSDDNFSFEASIEMDTPRLLYRVYDAPVLWFKARDTCTASGGRLATTFPVVTKQLKSLMVSGKLYWLGKSVTPWAWLRGCVSWSNPDRIQPEYMLSKYNQQGECASVCKGSVIFLLQNTSCYCLDKEQTTVRGPARDCNIRCPGNPMEHCGGSDVFTAYQYYDGLFGHDDGSNHCVSVARNQSYTPAFCDYPLGYTCELLNGSKITYSSYSDYPGSLAPWTDFSRLSWAESELFCSDLPDSAGLAPIPYWPVRDPHGVLWTSIVRSVDWHYPTVSARQPGLAYIGQMSYFEQYSEGLRNTANAYGFICQYEIPSCGGNLSTKSGVVTSPNYPDEYGVGQHCVWYLPVDAGEPTELVFSHLDIEMSPQCLYDYIQINQTLTSGTHTVRFCGSVLPEPIRVEAGDVTITFHADESINGRGFELWLNSGGQVVGLTVLVVAIVTIAAAVVACVLYRKRHAAETFTPAAVSVHSSTAVNAIYGMESFGDDASFLSSAIEGEKQDHPYENTVAEDGPINDDIAYDTVLPIGYSGIEGGNATVSTSDSLEQRDGSIRQPVVGGAAPKDNHATRQDQCIADANVYDNCREDEECTDAHTEVYSTVSYNAS